MTQFQTQIRSKLSNASVIFQRNEYRRHSVLQRTLEGDVADVSVSVVLAAAADDDNERR